LPLNGSTLEQIDDFGFSTAEHADYGRFVRVADSYRAAGDQDRAVALLRDGLETHSSYLPAYILLGRILTDQQRYAEALVNYERVLDLDPDNNDARSGIDAIMTRIKQDSEPQDRMTHAEESAAEEPVATGPLQPLPPQPDFTEPKPQTPTVAESTVTLADLLVGLLEYRDPHFRGGTSLTRLLAASIGRELGLTQDEVNAIELGIVLRDLGQVPIKELLARPESVLSAIERDRIIGHVETTLSLIAPLDLPSAVSDVIRYHHERWDGTGYPDGLVGKATPIGARIAGVADSFAAMISARPHRLPRRPPAAFEEISRLAGKQYDPTIVNALERVLEGADWRGVRFGLRHHVLIIDSDDPRGVALAVKLCSHGYLAEAVDLETARDRFEHARLSGIIISASVSESEIRKIVAELRQSARLAMLPVVVTDANGPSRVSFLEAGADVCLPVGSSFEELRATLGAFLRREDKSALHTRRRGEPPPWSGLQGDVQDFPLSWLLQMLNYDGRTAALFIEREDGDEGVIYLQNGQPRHAQTRSQSGDDALRQMLSWEKGSFRIGPEVKTEKQTIERPLMKLLLDQATQADHAAFFGAVHV